MPTGPADPTGGPTGPADPTGHPDAACPHPERRDGVCTACGHCRHDVILNGACYYCGTRNIDGASISPKPVSPLVPATRLVRGKKT